MFWFTLLDTQLVESRLPAQGLNPGSEHAESLALDHQGILSSSFFFLIHFLVQKRWRKNTDTIPWLTSSYFSFRPIFLFFWTNSFLNSKLWMKSMEKMCLQFLPQPSGSQQQMIFQVENFSTWKIISYFTAWAFPNLGTGLWWTEKTRVPGATRDSSFLHHHLDQELVTAIPQMRLLEPQIADKYCMRKQGFCEQRHLLKRRI